MIAPYRTEDEAMQRFDALAAESNCFRIYSEVSGELIQPRVGCEEKSVRIDRILIPLPRLVQAGWVHGPIGVEGKRHSANMTASYCDLQPIRRLDPN